jgi:hypothetical protein
VLDKTAATAEEVEDEVEVEVDVPESDVEHHPIIRPADLATVENAALPGPDLSLEFVDDGLSAVLRAAAAAAPVLLASLVVVVLVLLALVAASAPDFLSIVRVSEI